MCLAIPGKIIAIEQDAQGVRMGKTDFGGVLKSVCLEYTPDISCGDYVLVHVGFALGKVDREEAERTYKLLEEMNQLSELDSPSEYPATNGTSPPESAPLRI
ncbi:MAG TPA: HypC/HybG/HupF family hydrogenase formation chaperone [Candidatus Limnocylindrales bacterium]|jgi:hydrogenase expression/formation protein HypC|nr:HypC/HybG/HupF family hydrogenase formation chaperone [Candidatus Limnocylindrales bacterium]